MSFLGLDVGTTGCKAVAFDEEGRIVAQAYREYPLLHPKPGWSELDSDTLWLSIQHVLSEAVSRTRSDPIVALSVSSQGETVAPVGEDGRTLHNFVVTFDNRTEPQHRWWQERFGRREIFQITGMPLHPMYSVNKIMWFKENLGEVYRRARKFLCVEDFVIHRLTGSAVIDYSLAARTMGFDIRNKTWSEKILSFAGVDPGLLSEPRPSGYPVGKIARGTARELGMKSPATVAAGGHDQPCGALGSGVFGPGAVMNAIGTSDVLCPAFEDPILTDAMLANNYCCYPHASEGLYTTISFNLTGGLLLRWYRDTFCFEEAREAERTRKDVYDIIIDNASGEPSDVYILPHFVGSGTPDLDPESRGAILGLTIDTTKKEISRAVLDSSNYDLRLNADRLEGIGVSVDELRAIGGGAKSGKWLQLRADVLGKPVRTLKVSEAASLGAAILAGVGVRHFASAREGARAWVKIDRTFEPGTESHRKYGTRYENYLRIYPGLKKTGLMFSPSPAP